MTGQIANCVQCGSDTYVMPLHGERGGPPYCPICAGAWHAEHGRRRRAGRVVVKALRGYQEAGGSLYGKDFDALKLAAGGLFVPHAADTAGADFADLTSELLAATIALTHPDKHPPERKAEANRVTQELQALKPFVFPAPEPEPPPKLSDVSAKQQPARFNDPSAASAYPCEDCRDAAPMDYCHPCKARWDKEQEKERERDEQDRVRKNARQRERYQLYRKHLLAVQEPFACAMCGEEFEPKRRDTKYCSAACRQRAYVKREGKASNSTPLRPDDIDRVIEIAFTTEPDNAFTTDDLCEQVYAGLERPERKHRAAVVASAKRISERLGEHRDWWRYDQRGGTFVFWNRASLLSYAFARLKERGSYESDEDLTAAISPGGDYHDCVIEGGHWWQICQEDIARFKGCAA